mgnify:CR=1 FL=1
MIGTGEGLLDICIKTRDIMNLESKNFVVKEILIELNDNHVQDNKARHG